jgi:predicted HD phosphohydrolase
MQSRADQVRDETAAVLTSLRGVWDEVEVDEWQHAVQSAEQALLRGADDEVVLAAALHDVGHSPLLGGPGVVDHSGLARDWLTPRFGVRVGWLAGAHVAAKRHLAATDPAYAAALSPTSVASLAEQGGATIDSEFAAHPWHREALLLRRCDDAAKNPAADGAPEAMILDLAHRLAHRLAR